jgi:hypothetical protein
MPTASRFDHPDHQLGFPAQRRPQEPTKNQRHANPNGPSRDILGSIEDDDTQYRHYQSEAANIDAAHLRLHRGFSRRPPSSMPGESAFSSRVDIDETRRGRISPSNSRYDDDLLGTRNLRNDLAGSQAFPQATQFTEFGDYTTSTRASSRARMGNNPLYGAVDISEEGNYRVHPAYEGRAPYQPLDSATYISQPHHAQRRPLPDRIISPGFDPESAHRPSRSRFRTGSASNNSDKPRLNSDSDSDRDSRHFPRRHASRRPPSTHSDDETASDNQQPLTARDANTTNINPSAPSLSRKTKQRAAVPASNKRHTATTTTAAITTATTPTQPTHSTKTTAAKTTTKPKPKTKKNNHENPKPSTTTTQQPPNEPNPTPPTPPKVDPSADTGGIPGGVDYNPLSDTPLTSSGLQQQRPMAAAAATAGAQQRTQTLTQTQTQTHPEQ